MNITFLELTIRNFLSYGNNVTRLKLDFTDPTLVVGKNYDCIENGQVPSNGAGKTVILNAIAFCLYDKTISKIEKSEIVNYMNDKNMEISLIFEKSGMYYKVIRYRKNKAMGGDGVRLYENTSPVFEEKHQRTSTTVNADIEAIMGVPYDIFARIVVISATFDPFLSLPGSSDSKANQRDIIEELFNMTEMTRKADALKKLIKDNNLALKTLVEQNERITAERLRTKIQLDAAQLKAVNWDADHLVELDAALDSLEPLLVIDFTGIKLILADAIEQTEKCSKIERVIEGCKRDIDAAIRNNQQLEAWNSKSASEKDATELNIAELSGIDVDYLTEVELKIKELNVKITTEARNEDRLLEAQLVLDKTMDKLLEEVEHLKGNMCPYCQQTFKESKAKLAEKKKEILNSQTELDQLDDSILKAKSLSRDLKDELTPFLLTAIPPNLKAIGARKISLAAQLASLESQTNPYTRMDEAAYDKELERNQRAFGDCVTEIGKLNLKMDAVNNSRNWSLMEVQRAESEIEKLSEKVRYLNKQVNPFTSIVTDLTTLLNNKLDKVDTDKVDELDNLLAHQEFLLKLLTRKDSFVRKALLNKNISYLNTRLSHYLILMGLPHKVLFNEEMGVNISQFGTVYKWPNMSSGQKARINLSLSFSFRDVLQARFSKMNFCVLDECLDVGLDTVGVQSASKMLKNIAVADGISMLIISHRDEMQSMFGEKLEIELRDRFSNVISGKILLPSPTVLDP